MERPVEVALARAVTKLPIGEGWWYEPKFDGHRIVLFREPDAVALQSRTGRDVTNAWPDLAAAGLDLPVGTVVDGEAVIWNEGVLDFAAVQARAASAAARARLLSHRLPASYAIWDLLAHPELGDIRARPYVERRALLLDVLADVGPPLQAVPATNDPEIALRWYQALQTQNIEGVVAKRADGAYRSGRSWHKIRHSETVDSEAVGYTGNATHPRTVVVRLPDGRTAQSQTLTAPLSRRLAQHIAASGPGRRARTDDGERYTTTGGGLILEALAGTTRHAVVTIVRAR
ncbi:hypothetical protein QIS99_28055 [Streptomyces sp. B-S-A8]|uniref:ATP-dependent DNA ligase family profile domain-containing protein n=1 Tax=Streptomyces solicavernae TaxID=3043614 RepID=A0ABT6RZZ6_9ACTN|nr:hypothetical protein [Streptomyces sp. B-S-A8]MDI3390016.1 hypothetical protein [Streptomyces sp. B-S-A8]